MWTSLRPFTVHFKSVHRQNGLKGKEELRPNKMHGSSAVPDVISNKHKHTQTVYFLFLPVAPFHFFINSQVVYNLSTLLIDTIYLLLSALFTSHADTKFCQQSFSLLWICCTNAGVKESSVKINCMYKDVTVKSRRTSQMWNHKCRPKFSHPTGVVVTANSHV